MPYRIGLVVAIGFVAGTLSGLLGVGGGIVIVPALVYLIHLSQRQAHGTSLVAILFTAIAGALYYSSSGEANWVIAMEMAFGGVIGAMIGARLCSILSNRRLRQFFGVLLILVGVRMLSDLALNGHSTEAHRQIVDATTLLGGAAVIALGVFTGILSGMLGIGGGVIMIPAMVFLLGLTQKLAQGISLAVIVPVSISGSLMHYRQGNVEFQVGFWVAVGGLLGSLTGARFALGAQETTLRALFGLLMLGFGIATVRTRSRKVVEPAQTG
jgi:hypothetical protein